MELAENVVQSDDVKSSLLPWLVCFAATLFFFYEFIQGNMFASIASDIMRDFQIQADEMAYMSSMYYLANVLFLFVAGMVLDRFSIKKTLIFAMFLCVISTFILAYSQSFTIAMMCRFVTGIGSAFCFLGPIRLASQWFPPQRMAFVSGAIVTMAMLGGLLAQFPLTKLVQHVGWRQAVQDVGVLGAVMLVLMVLWIKEKAPTEKEKSEPYLNVFQAAQKAYFNTQYVRAALYTSLMNMAIAIFGALMGTLYLEQRLSSTAEQASMINGMLFFGAIIGAPLIGWISDKAGVRILPMKVCLLISLLILCGILYAPVSVTGMMFLFFLLGLFTSGQVISYALIAESSSPQMTATALSVISLLTQGGYFVYQNLFSKLLTAHGSMQLVNEIPVYSLNAYQHAALLLPIGLVIAFIMLLGLRETYCNQFES